MKSYGITLAFGLVSCGASPLGIATVDLGQGAAVSHSDDAVSRAETGPRQRFSPGTVRFVPKSCAIFAPITDADPQWAKMRDELSVIPLRELGKMGPDAVTELDYVLEMAGSESACVRGVAIWALGEISPCDFDVGLALRRAAASDANSQVRWQAGQAVTRSLLLCDSAKTDVSHE